MFHFLFLLVISNVTWGKGSNVQQKRPRGRMMGILEGFGDRYLLPLTVMGVDLCVVVVDLCNISLYITGHVAHLFIDERRKDLGSSMIYQSTRRPMSPLVSVNMLALQSRDGSRSAHFHHDWVSPLSLKKDPKVNKGRRRSCQSPVRPCRGEKYFHPCI